VIFIPSLQLGRRIKNLHSAPSFIVQAFSNSQFHALKPNTSVIEQGRIVHLLLARGTIKQPKKPSKQLSRRILDQVNITYPSSQQGKSTLLHPPFPTSTSYARMTLSPKSKLTANQQ